MTKAPRQQLQIKVLARFLDKKALEELIEEYKNNLYVYHSRPTELSQNQIKLIKDFDMGMSFSQIARKYKTSISKVQREIMWGGLLSRKK